MPMHNPLMSQEGRALMGKLQQLPPDQHQQYLSSQVGMIPFGELVAIKQQMDTLKNSAPQAQAPQTTVAQDLLQQIQQARSPQPQMPPQQMAPRPQMPPQQMAPRPQMPPQSQGVAGLPANVGSEKAYASGGIVAFSEAGSVKAKPSSKEEWNEYLRQHPGTDPTEALKRFGMNYLDLVKLPFSLPSKLGKGIIFDTSTPYPKQTPAEVYKGVYGYDLTNSAPQLEGSTKVPGAELKPSTDPTFANFDYTSAPQLQGMYADLNGGTPFGQANPSLTSGPSAPAPSWGANPLGLAGLMGDEGGSGRASASTSFRSPLKGAAPDTWENPVKVQTPEEYQAAVEEEARKAGVGNAAKAQRAALEGREKENESGKKKSGWDAFSEAGFRMAEAASKPGATVLGSAAAGGIEGVKAYREATKDAKATAAKLQDARFALDSAEEQFKYNQSEKARDRLDKAQTKYESAQLKHEENTNDLDKIRLQGDYHLLAAKIAAAATEGNRGKMAKLMDEAEYKLSIMPEGPQKEAAVKQFNQLIERHGQVSLSTPAGQAAQIGASTAASKQVGAYRAAAIKSTEARLGMMGSDWAVYSKLSPEKKAEYKQMVFNQELANASGNIGGGSNALVYDPATGTLK